MNGVSLFSGIGGLELGLQRAGITIVGQVERDPWCREVLEQHWPEVDRHDDVRTAVDWWRSAVRPAVDIVAGGFPCQPFANPGLKLGIADERWGWPWMLDFVRAVRPRFVLAENVSALLRDVEAFSIILGDLSDLGFDVEWDVVSACSLGAPHRRPRLFTLAHTHVLHGREGLGAWPTQRLARSARRPSAREHVGAAARAWRDRVDGAVEASRADDRETDGAARRMVAAGGNAVVPQVAEHIGRMITGAAA